MLFNIKAKVKKIAMRSRVLAIAGYIYKDWYNKRRYKKGDTENASGSSHSNKTVVESVAYIRDIVNSYLKYSGMTAGSIASKRILKGMMLTARKPLS